MSRMRCLPLQFIQLTVGIFLASGALAQFAPPAGQPGTTAVYKDSSAFIAWSVTCSVERGFVNMADTLVVFNGSNKATYGSYLYGSGPPDELVVSLGDHGVATLGFEPPIRNHPGPDFAVFENSFGDSFLELGFVEVSSDGSRFVRFPAVSLTLTELQLATFDTIDATKINNFAGKYKHAYGTPFDLDDITDSTGIDLDHITYVRVIDAGGCLLAPFVTFDSQGNRVNDPWPTPFDTGGFDLDAVGAMEVKVSPPAPVPVIRYFPNPVTGFLNVESKNHSPVKMVLSDITGNRMLEIEIMVKAAIDLGGIAPGMYIAEFVLNDGSLITKKIIRY